MIPAGESAAMFSPPDFFSRSLLSRDAGDRVPKMGSLVLVDAFSSA
jgi:hypothetical protein